MKNDRRNSKKHIYSNMFVLVCIMGVALGILLEVIHNAKRNQKSRNEDCMQRPRYWIYPNSARMNNRSGSAKHVHYVLERIGYEKGSNTSSWDLMWAYPYPRNVLKNTLMNLKPHQRFNHYPGISCLVNKVELATTDSKDIPKAFRLPRNKQKFLKYVQESKNSLFLEKLNDHRGVRVKNVSQFNLTDPSKFVQEYIQNPLLVDGHRFDIGVYVVITSVNPMRAYWYMGDVLIRYCPSKYYPFDPNDLNKYVIKEGYLPTWELPSLAIPFKVLGYGMKGSLDIYLKSKGIDPSPMWKKIQKVIAKILRMKEHYIIKAIKKYPSPDNFFEMLRFDLIVDENLRVYLLEANMTPNLDSTRLSRNGLLYEQLLYNMFSLTGVSQRQKSMCAYPNSVSAAKEMVTSFKNIAVFGEQCTSACKATCNELPLCNLCKPCLEEEMKKSLMQAHTEFLHRGDFRRLVPWPMSQVKDMKDLNTSLPKKDLNRRHKLQQMWYQEKCNQEIAWCT